MMQLSATHSVENMNETVKITVVIDPDVAPLLAAERSRLTDQAGLRNVSVAACINAVLRRALQPAEARNHG